MIRVFTYKDDILDAELAAWLGSKLSTILGEFELISHSVSVVPLSPTWNSPARSQVVLSVVCMVEARLPTEVAPLVERELTRIAVKYKIVSHNVVISYPSELGARPLIIISAVCKPHEGWT